MHINLEKYKNDGRGYRYIGQDSSSEEKDPLYSQERELLARKSDIPDASIFATKDEIPSVPDYSDFARKSDVVSYDKIISLKRSNAQYIGDSISIDAHTPGRVVSMSKLIVNTAIGDISPSHTIAYSGGYIRISCPEISKNSQWESLKFYYSTETGVIGAAPSLAGRVGRNFIMDESAGNPYHSNVNRMVFEAVYKKLGGSTRNALESIPLVGGSIHKSSAGEMASKYKFNIYARPYAMSAIDEDESANPDILGVVSHYGNYMYDGAIAEGKHGKLSDTKPNTGDVFNITDSRDKFLDNVVAVSAGDNLDGTGKWTSYGNGVEFFEPCSHQYLDETYPEKSTYFVVAQAHTEPGGIMKSLSHRKFTNGLSVGDELHVHREGGLTETVTISEILSSDSLKYTGSLTPIPAPGVYVWCYVRLSYLYSPNPAQSPTCSVVAAKLAAIQDKTGASWSIVREAARKTASNCTSYEHNGITYWDELWDSKKGFGCINVDNAVRYIKSKYSENAEYKDSAQISLPKYNSLLTIDDIDDNNPVTKGQLIKILEGYQKK